MSKQTLFALITSLTLSTVGYALATAHITTWGLFTVGLGLLLSTMACAVATPIKKFLVNSGAPSMLTKGHPF